MSLTTKSRSKDKEETEVVIVFWYDNKLVPVDKYIDEYWQDCTALIGL